MGHKRTEEEFWLCYPQGLEGPRITLRQALGEDAWKERAKRYQREYRKLKAERIKCYAEEFDKKHPDYQREYQRRRWERIKADPATLEKYRADRRNWYAKRHGPRKPRKASIRGTEFRSNVPKWRAWKKTQLERQKWRCALCQIDLKSTRYDVDHIVPKSEGGRAEESNLLILCRKCNLEKTNKRMFLV